MILNLQPKTSTSMVLGELGAVPINQIIQSRLLNFWAKIVMGKTDKISYILYNLMHNLYVRGIYECPWLISIKSLLDSIGCSEYWLAQSVPGPNCFKHQVKSRLHDQYLQSWRSSVHDSSKCLNYRIFKTELALENYLTLLPWNLAQYLCKFAQYFCKFRTRNCKLPIETGTFYGVERSQRLCTLCDQNQVGDEFHYLFCCNFFVTERERCIPRYFIRNPNALKFEQLMSSDDKSILIKLSNFVKIILLHFRNSN